MKSERLQIKFEGEQHQIDANTLVGTLIHYSALINEINTLYSEGTRSVNIKVNAIEKGSFIIDISLIESLKDIVLFAKNNIDYVYKIGGLAVSIITLYKFYKGKRINSKDNIITINLQNNIQIDNKTIVNIYNNLNVRESISKSIEIANNDDSVEGISFSTQETKTEISKNEFEELIYDDFDSEEALPNTRDVIDDNAILSIITLSFNKTKKWEFLYYGFKISVPVKDKILRSLIDGGLRFAKGDSIVVKLNIQQQYSQEYNDYVNKKYGILEFKKHIPRPDQQILSF